MSDANGFMLAVVLIVLTVLIGWICNMLNGGR